MIKPPRYNLTIFVWITLILWLLKITELVDLSWWTVSFWLWAPWLALSCLVGGSAFLCFVFWVMRIGENDEN